MKKHIAIALILVLCLSLTACTDSSVDGYYEFLNADSGYRFIKSGINKGTYILYNDGAPVKTEAYELDTNTWELDGDVLTLDTSYGATLRFKVYQDTLIWTTNREPKGYDFIAPEGYLFDYEFYEYQFYEDGTFEYDNGVYNNRGQYYRSFNIIYTKYDGDTEYIPALYIYNGNHITSAGRVLVKDTFTRQIGNWFDSLIHG